MNYNCSNIVSEPDGLSSFPSRSRWLEYYTVHEIIHHLLEKTLVEKVHQLVEETCLMRHSLHAPERDEEALCR